MQSYLGYPVTPIIWAAGSVRYGTHISVHVHAVERHAHMHIVRPVMRMCVGDGEFDSSSTVHAVQSKK